MCSFNRLSFSKSYKIIILSLSIISAYKIWISIFKFDKYLSSSMFVKLVEGNSTLVKYGYSSKPLVLPTNIFAKFKEFLLIKLFHCVWVCALNVINMIIRKIKFRFFKERFNKGRAAKNRHFGMHEHINFFNKKSIETLCKNNGLKTVFFGMVKSEYCDLIFGLAKKIN